MRLVPVDVPVSWSVVMHRPGGAMPVARTVRTVRRVAVRSLDWASLDGEVELDRNGTRMAVLDGIGHMRCVVGGGRADPVREDVLRTMADDPSLVRKCLDAFGGPADPSRGRERDDGLRTDDAAEILVDEGPRVAAELDECARRALLVDGVLHTSRMQPVFNMRVPGVWQEMDVMAGRGFSSPDLRPQSDRLPIPFLDLPGLFASGRRPPPSFGPIPSGLVRSSGTDLALAYLRTGFSAAADWYRADQLAGGTGTALHAVLLTTMERLSRGRVPEAPGILASFAEATAGDPHLAPGSGALARMVEAYLGHAEFLEGLR